MGEVAGDESPRRSSRRRPRAPRNWITATRSNGSACAFARCDSRSQRAWLGAGTRNDQGRLVVTSVRRDTPALAGGLSVEDEILAIDDVRVRADGLAARLEQYRPGDKIVMLVSRRDRLTKVDVTLGAEPGRAWRLEVNPDATDAQKAQPERLARSVTANQTPRAVRLLVVVPVSDTGARSTLSLTTVRLAFALVALLLLPAAVSGRYPRGASGRSPRRPDVESHRHRRQAGRTRLGAGAGDQRIHSARARGRQRTVADDRRPDRLRRNDALYVGVRANDTDAIADRRAFSRGAISARRPTGSKVVVDSYFDRRSAYEFAVNPVGVKTDRYYFNDGNSDDSWDAVWDVEVVARRRRAGRRSSAFRSRSFASATTTAARSASP